MNIQWYPGHMAKTKKMIIENISLVDIVIELIDSRIPYSSKNPDIDNLAKNKFRIIILNKADLADETKTNTWKEYFQNKGFKVIILNSLDGKGMNSIISVSRELMQEKIERLKKRGRIFVPIRAMVTGIPNVGKSTFINKFVGKSTAKTGDKPGVTKAKQWIRIKKDFELLDTPGILWPKFDDENVGLKLAFTGAINDDIIDIHTLSLKLIEYLLQMYPENIKKRYKIEFNENSSSDDILWKIGEQRGFKIKGGEIDITRTSNIFIDEFRASKLGKITLETIDTIQSN